MRIAVLSYIDCAHSARQITEALNRHTIHRAKYFGLKGYLDDYALQRIKDSDVVIVKGDELAKISDDGELKLYRNKRPVEGQRTRVYIRKDAIRIYIPSGSWFRRCEGCKDGSRAGSRIRNRMPWNHIGEWKAECDFIYALTADLNYTWNEGAYLGHAIDTDRYTPNAKIYGKPPDKLFVACYPGGMTGDRKGVRTYLLPAIKRLQGEGREIYVEQLIGYTREKALKIMRESDLYFVSADNVGAYGMSGIEAMSQGIPIMGHLSEETIRQSGVDYAYPCITIEKSIDDICDKLKKIMDGDIDLNEYSQRGREYALKHHSYPAIAEKLDRKIREIGDKKW